MESSAKSVPDGFILHHKRGRGLCVWEVAPPHLFLHTSNLCRSRKCVQGIVLAVCFPNSSFAFVSHRALLALETYTRCSEIVVMHAK